MTKRHFIFAARQIMDYMALYNFGIQSLPLIDAYKQYIDFFTKFSKDFVKEKFDEYIINNFKNGKTARNMENH